MSNKIIAFVGMPGSGKGTCVEYFTNLGAPNVYFGGMVYEEVEKRGLDRVKDEKEVREDMRKTEGPAVFAKRAATKARQYFAEGIPLVIFDGIYSWSEYTYLKEAFGDIITVVAVVTDRNMRHQRVLARKDGRIYTAEEVEARDRAEIENLEKGGPIANADHYILNNGTMEDLREQLDSLSVSLNTN